MRRAFVFAVTGGLLSTPVHSVEHDFDIPAASAEESVQQLAREAGLSVLYEMGRLNRYRTREVKGRYEPQEALRKLLDGSGLYAREIISGFISVDPVPQEPAQELPHAGTPIIRISADRFGSRGPLPNSIPIRTISSEELTRTGLTTTSDWVRTLTQNQGAGANEGTSFQREASTNIAYGSGLNLYGVGQRATLVLVNGHRLAPSGSTGSFTDVLNIPLSMVDRIDLYSDDASTLYGADAIGGIVNFVLRDGYSRPLTFVSLGDLTRGDLAGNELGQSYAAAGALWRGIAAVEYYDRNGLPAADRSQATSNMTPQGGSNFDMAFGNPPTLIDSHGRYWGIAADQRSSILTPGELLDQPNLYDRHAGTWILPRQRRLTAYVGGSYDLADSTTMFIESLWGQRRTDTYLTPAAMGLSVPASNAFYANLFPGSNGPLEVLYGFGKDFGPIKDQGIVNSGQFTLGLAGAVDDHWHLAVTDSVSIDNQREYENNLVKFDELTQYLAMSDPRRAFNPFGTGPGTNPDTLAAIRTNGRLEYQSVYVSFNLEAVGSLPLQPVGNLPLTLGYERRYQVFWSDISPEFNFAGQAFNLSRERRLDALYLQASLPLSALTLTGGLRYEHFNDIGGACMPSLRFSFELNEGLSFTGSWSKMRRPPNLSDLDESVNYATSYRFADPNSPTGYTTALLWSGNNAQLSPEIARSWLLGVKYSRQELGLALDAQYFNIVSSGQVVAPQIFESSAFSDPHNSSLITRNVTPAALASVCSRIPFFYGATDNCRNPGIEAIVDLRLRSAQTVRTDGFDISGLYRLPTRAGELQLNLQATYVLDYAAVPQPGDELISFRDTPHNPIALKLRGVLGWQTEHLFVTPAVNFQSSYTDTVSVPNRPVSSWTTWDLVMGYRLDKTTTTLRGANVFNKQPPFLNNNIGAVAYDPENADLLGRRVSPQLRYGW